MEDRQRLNNRYQLLETLGRGGMARVYRARDLMLERYVAVKILREDHLLDPTFQDRFRLEARAAANLSHPNIVTVHDFGLDDGKLFIVMEYVPGTDLKTLIQRRGRFTPEEALPLVIQACAGIGYAHRAGLVHCDVKPQNMLVTPDQRLKVADFGISRALASIRPGERTDVVWGSPQYFSPEQASGAVPSPASDVYSLGVVLYEMLTGSLPFDATTATKLARLHLAVTPPPLGEALPDASPALEQILIKVLSKEPSARYRTADQFGRVLQTFGNARTAPPLTSTTEMASVTAAPAQPEPGAQRATHPRTIIEPPAQPEPVASPSANIDWAAVGLGLLALLAVGGLVPFWVWVYFVYNPPIR
jgi:serine/threonine-protein kinase